MPTLNLGLVKYRYWGFCNQYVVQKVVWSKPLVATARQIRRP